VQQAADLSDLALRSKATLGYDRNFLDACKQELTYSAEQIESSKWQFWIATSTLNVLKGFVALEFTNRDCVEINALFIAPDFMYQGVGTALFQKALEQIKLVQATQIMLYSDPNAVAFYQKMGFNIISKVASGSIKGRTIPLMQRSLLKD
jgi:N-acetylglutamate synthase-like GNAT family acetyltransferase